MESQLLPGLTKRPNLIFNLVDVGRDSRTPISWCPVVGLLGGHDVDVVTRGGLSVAAAGWPSRSWPGEFRCANGAGGLHAEVSNPRQTRAGDRRCGGAGFSQGRRRSAAAARARRSWVWAARISQVQRSAACGVRNFGQVQTRICLNRRNVCSMSKRRRNVCRSRSISAGVESTPDHHSHTGFGIAPLGR